jgi:CheY-like chemotaxis protein
MYLSKTGGKNRYTVFEPAMHMEVVERMTLESDKQSGGFIWVYGEPRMGATFKICLPLIDEGADEVRPSQEAAQDLRGAETVLLVEDDELLRPLARTLLSSCGYTVLEASNAADAMAVLHAHEGPIDLMLTDVVMPGESGVVLSQRVTSERPSIKVLFMSGYTDEAVMRHGQLLSGAPPPEAVHPRTTCTVCPKRPEFLTPCLLPSPPFAP